jgi:hypothetical protein
MFDCSASLWTDIIHLGKRSLLTVLFTPTNRAVRPIDPIYAPELWNATYKCLNPPDMQIACFIIEDLINDRILLPVSFPQYLMASVDLLTSQCTFQRAGFSLVCSLSDSFFAKFCSQAAEFKYYAKPD